MSRSIIQINQDMAKLMLIKADPTASKKEKEEADRKLKELRAESTQWFKDNQ